MKTCLRVSMVNLTSLLSIWIKSHLFVLTCGNKSKSLPSMHSVLWQKICLHPTSSQLFSFSYSPKPVSVFQLYHAISQSFPFILEMPIFNRCFSAGYVCFHMVYLQDSFLNCNIFSYHFPILTFFFQWWDIVSLVIHVNVVVLNNPLSSHSLWIPKQDLKLAKSFILKETSILIMFCTKFDANMKTSFWISNEASGCYFSKFRNRIWRRRFDNIEIHYK